MLHARAVPPRYFTPQEANELVPTLRAYLFKVRAQGQELRQLEHARQAAGSAEERQRIDEAKRQVQLGQGHLLDRILDLGAELLDPLELGRVRFPALRNGEPVWLYWTLGEPRVLKWAPVSARLFGPRPVKEPGAVRWEWRN